jgi:multidrug efflux pump subunit AcrA (membrane-fusion protein)
MQEKTGASRPHLLRRIGGGLKRALWAVGRFCKKHKVLTVLLAVLLAAAIAVGVPLLKARQAASAASATYSFVRTTTLTKGSLDDTVSTTGTVESADTSTVSYNATAATGTSTPKIKTVNVAVGDSVNAGDVIVTLDTSDIEESIEKEKENLADQVSKAQKTYDDAVDAYNEALSTAQNYESTVSAASSTLSAAKSAYETAAASLAAYQSAYDAANTSMVNAGTALNLKNAALDSANAALSSAQAALDSANAALAASSPSASDYAALQAAAASAQSARDAASTAQQTAEKEQSEAQSSYSRLQSTAAAAQATLSAAKANCNYDALNQAYAAAQQTYTQERATLDQYEKAVSSTSDAVDTAKENLENASTSDTLESLEDQLAACSLTAETSGKVTSLTASVGSAPSGTIATIQDTGSLKVSITIEQADINSVSIGMTCRITSDATDGEISGTLTQIDPVAGQDGSFGAEVTVNDADTGLLVGMNATVEIVLSSTADCFTVPIDAVGNDNDGSGDYVYRQTGGSGTDMTFEKVYVTTGESNDYYIEISGDDLSEGDVIRSSADLTQGVEETSSSDSASTMFSMFGGGAAGGNGGANAGGGTMPSGGGNMPSGGGSMPSGGQGGGQ